MSSHDFVNLWVRFISWLENKDGVFLLHHVACYQTTSGLEALSKTICLKQQFLCFNLYYNSQKIIKFQHFTCQAPFSKVTNKAIGMCNFILKNVIEDFSRVLNYNLTMYSFRAYTHKLPLSLQSFYIFNQFHEFFSSEKYKKNWCKCDLVSNWFKSQPRAVKRRGLLRISNPPLNMVKS